MAKTVFPKREEANREIRESLDNLRWVSVQMEAFVGSAGKYMKNDLIQQLRGNIEIIDTFVQQLDKCVGNLAEDNNNIRNHSTLVEGVAAGFKSFVNEMDMESIPAYKLDRLITNGIRMAMEQWLADNTRTVANTMGTLNVHQVVDEEVGPNHGL